MKHANINVIGSGLVGSLLSIFLAKRGHTVTAFERRGDMRIEKMAAGRSINLALSDRGWRALEKVGITEDIQAISIPMKGRMIHAVNGDLSFQPYGKEDQAIYSVSRGVLNCKLMDLAEQQGVKIHFNERCTAVNQSSKKVDFENVKTGQKSSHVSDLIFGSDGAYSAARLQLQLGTDRFNYSQYYIPHGYKELTIPAGPNGSFQIDKNALHIWPRGEFMLIALPNLDGSFTCTLFFPFEGESSFATLKTDEQILDFFKRVFPDTLDLIPNLVEEFKHNPVASLVTVKCYPWRIGDSMMLIGDAAHAIVPFFGQGMNCGFEDCLVLDGLLEAMGDDWSAIFDQFQTLRKPDGDAIADLALQNFIEMRDLVAQPEFRLRKQIEARFSNLHPEKWTPQYSLVTFSPHVRYSEALAEGRRQEKIMDQIMAMPDIAKKWDSKEVEEKLLELLA